MIPLVPAIVPQNAYILYIRALRFGDPVQDTAATQTHKKAAPKDGFMYSEVVDLVFNNFIECPFILVCTKISP